MTQPYLATLNREGKCDDTALLTAITEKPIQMVAESIKPEVAGAGRKKE